MASAAVAIVGQEISSANLTEEKEVSTIQWISGAAGLAVSSTPGVPHAPELQGLTFRRFYGEQDYQSMADVITGSKDADGLERTATVEDVARSYRHLINCNPYEDTLFAEVNGQVVGYSRVWWQQELKGIRRYLHFVHLLPDWRGKGIRRCILRQNEHRLREIAAGHPDNRSQTFDAWAADTETHWETLLREEGYVGVRYGFSMVRPDLEDLPNLPLPEGLEVRPVVPDQIPLIWQSAKEAFRDHWGYSEDEWSIEHLREWQESATYDPNLWQVAWAGDQVAGMVLNFINEQENAEYGRKRGYTEDICVRRRWRRQGLARALIARSLWVLRERGMTEAALGVDAQNPNGALQLYKSAGFRTVKRHTTYRKPLH
jgi:mycothiol synthase